MSEDDERIETEEEALRVLDVINGHIEAVTQTLLREMADHSPRDDGPVRRECEEHLNEAERLCLRLMTKSTKMSARTRATAAEVRTTIVQARAMLRSGDTEPPTMEALAAPNQVTKES